MKSSVLGLLLGAVLIGYSLVTMTDNSIIFLNMVALLLVFGGTISVSIITYGLKEVLNVISIFFKVFTSSKHNERSVAQELIQLSQKTYNNSAAINTALKDTELHPFVQDGLRLIENNFPKEQIEYIMKNMIRERHAYFRRQVQILQVIAKYPPAFGMIGTIIGLVAVLDNLAKFTEVSSLGPNMAVALVTTLYGLFIANYIFSPIADNLLAASEIDLKQRRMIIEGVLLIKDNEDPVFFSEVINGYMLPSMKIETKNTGDNFESRGAA